MAPPPKARPRGRVLTASALVAAASRGDDTRSEYRGRTDAEWQKRALAYADIVPELSFGSRFYARMLKQVRFYPAKLHPDGRVEEIKTGPPVERLAQIRDPGGGRSQLQGQYGRLMFITGEGVLFGRDLETSRERWSFVWKDEIVVDKESGKITHQPNGAGGEKTEYEASAARAYPMWMPAPRLSGEADSPMRAVMKVAAELVVLTDSVMATALTRLTTPILIMPTDASPGPADGADDDDPEEDPFASDLQAHMAAQIENPDDPEARNPLILWLQEDLVEKPRTLKLHDPATDYLEKELRKEAIERMALGMDMPPEALTGLGDSNHWSAIQILGDMWKSHGLGVALQFAADLAEVYLRPGLEADEYEGWEDVVVGVDGSQVVIKADRSDDAAKAIEHKAIGPSGFRKMLHIPEDYAPTPEELEQMQPRPVEGASSRNGNGDMPPEQPAPPGPEGDSGRRTRVVAAAFREMGAAEAVLMRCRELAGMRLRNQRVWRALEGICVDCVTAAEGRPLSVVAAAIGPEQMRALGLDPQTLVRGGADTLRELLLGWGYPLKQADALAEMVEVYAARTLFEEAMPALPSGFEAQFARTKELTDAVGNRAA